MTEAIGPGTRLRYVGARGATNHSPLMVGRVYTVSEVVEGSVYPCQACGSFTGVFLASVPEVFVRPWGRMAWSVCAFRPEGDGEAVAALRKTANAPDTKRGYVRKRVPEEVA